MGSEMCIRDSGGFGGTRSTSVAPRTSVILVYALRETYAAAGAPPRLALVLASTHKRRAREAARACQGATVERCETPDSRSLASSALGSAANVSLAPAGHGKRR